LYCEIGFRIVENRGRLPENRQGRWFEYSDAEDLGVFGRGIDLLI
jgi:hypothetical protein